MSAARISGGCCESPRSRAAPRSSSSRAVMSWTATGESVTLNSSTTNASVCSAVIRWVSARVRSATACRHCQVVATAPAISDRKITAAAATAPVLRRTNDDTRYPSVSRRATTGRRSRQRRTSSASSCADA